jgi:hypothetical protein
MEDDYTGSRRDRFSLDSQTAAQWETRLAAFPRYTPTPQRDISLLPRGS